MNKKPALFGRCVNVLQHCSVLALILFWGVGISHTYFRWPAAPNQSLVRFSYGTQAPYQGYSRSHSRLRVQIEANGTWTEFPLQTIWPFSYGEVTLRSALRTFSYSPARKKIAYEQLAQKIYTYLQLHNQEVERVTLDWIEWPYSPAGKEFLNKEPYVTATLITTYP